MILDKFTIFVKVISFNRANATDGDKEFLLTYAVAEALVTTSLFGCLHDNCFAAGEAAGKHDHDFTTLKANLKKVIERKSLSELSWHVR